MINEIKRRLEAGEEVELECIDRQGFVVGEFKEMNNKILARKSLVVKSVSAYSHFIYLEEDIEQVDAYVIRKEELKHFKIKENKKTFYDLVDVAVQAGKDSVLTGVRVDFEGVRCLRIRHKKYTDQIFDQHDNYSENIEYIKSLYTETFVIESEKDMLRIKSNAEITLVNGEKITSAGIINNLLSYFSSNEDGEDTRNNYVEFTFIKGATVTQRKTNN